MAEVVGTVSAVLSIVQLASKLVGCTRHVWNSEKDWKRFTAEVDSLSKAVTTWTNSAEALQSQNPGHKHEALNHLQTLLLDLETRASKKPTLARRLAFQYTKADVEELFRGIEGAKLQFSIDLDHDILTQGQTHFSLIAEKLGALTSAVSLLSRSFGGPKREDFQMEHEYWCQKIIHWISPLNFRQRQQDVFAQRTEGTGEWLLNSSEYEAWRNGSAATVLWCPGMPGAGKTIISSVAINDLQTMTHDTRPVSMCIFCNHKERTDQTYTNLVASLLRQLVEECGSVSKQVEELYTKHTKKNTRPTSQEFLDALKLEISTFRSIVFIVVDALDEGPEHEGMRADLVADLRNLSGACRLMITSRDLPSIGEIMVGVPRLEIHAHAGDIEKYIEGRLSREPRLRRLLEHNSELQALLIPTVKDKSGGMFLIAKLHMDMLASKHSGDAIRDALLNPPKGFDAIYDDVINRIRGQTQVDKHLAENALRWVAYTRRPLSVIELRYALTVPQRAKDVEPAILPDMAVVLSVCAGMLAVDEVGKSVRLIHYTAQEYFNRNQASKFSRVHDQLAEACIAYLVSSACSEGPCRGRTDLYNRMEQYPLLDYAAHNWGLHVRGCKHHTSTGALDFILNPPLFAAATQILLRKQSKDGIHGWVGFSALHAAAYFDECAPPPTGLQGITNIHKSTLGATNLAAQLDDANVHSKNKSGWYEIVQRLLAQPDIDVNSRDRDGRTPLSYAAEKGCDEVTRLLLANADVAVNSKDNHGRTPLTYAIENAKVPIVVLLLTHKDVDINIKDEDGRIPLSYAVRESNEITRLLLTRKEVDVESKDSYGHTPLSHAAIQGKHEIVQVLLAREEVNINSKSTDGRTPLSYAVTRRRDEVVRVLFTNNNVDINSKDRQGYTPLSLAVLGGMDEIVRLLLTHKDVKVNSKDKIWRRTPLFHAVEHGNNEIVRLLLTHEDVKVNSKDKIWGRTPLSHAVEHGNDGIVRLLLAHKDIDTNSKDKSKDTPLLHAIDNKSDSIVRLLLASKNIDANLGKYTTTPLLYAIERGRVKIAQLLLAHQGVDVHSRDNLHNDSLLWAVKNGQDKIVRLLLARGDVDVNSKDYNGHTPLFHAVQQRAENIVQLLLAHADVDINSKAQDGWTPLLYAAVVGRDEIIQLLLAHRDGSNNTHGCASLFAAKGDLIQQLLSRNVDWRDHCGRTLLSHAAEAGGDRVVRLLLASKGVDINSKDEGGCTPLIYAVREGRVGVVEQLLASTGIKINLEDTSGCTPFLRAVMCKNDEIVRLFLQHDDVDINSRGRHSDSPVFEAIRSGGDEIVRLLLKREDLDINSMNRHGRSLLSCAVRQGRKEIIQWLLTHKDVNINLLDKDGWSPLSCAVNTGKKEIVQQLLAHEHVDVNLKNKYGWINIRSLYGDRLEIIQLLLAHKDIQVNAKDNYGRTLLSCLIQFWDGSGVTELLLARDVDINSKDKDGRAALWYAVRYGSPEIVELLLSKQGIDIDTRDKLGRTPLSEAAVRGRLESLELLLAHGAAADVKDYFGLTPHMRAWWSWTWNRKVILQALKASDWKYVSK